jgi:hypothetical protein
LANGQNNLAKRCEIFCAVEASIVMPRSDNYCDTMLKPSSPDLAAEPGSQGEENVGKRAKICRTRCESSTMRLSGCWRKLSEAFPPNHVSSSSWYMLCVGRVKNPLWSYNIRRGSTNQFVQLDVASSRTQSYSNYPTVH